ncbi:MAG: Hsp70 family protein [Puniceicoccales bacterium]|jgi:molecular chaperone DnaK|nr:Hsp70 family protein [Puniceicoccales bacterium]
MKNFIGIDLGTTNSAICSYDGEQVHIYKSLDQMDVTPSAIYIDRRSNKYVGKRAYDSTLNDPDNVAVRFKRFMGTNTPINIPNLGKSMSPEECSAEILKVLFNYLPDDMQKDPDICTVITVPAAFNQMQKDATLQAANMAGIGKIALMQEPVAAIMSVMKTRPEDGIFLIYDLGGGTLDIAVAESINGHVNLQSHGGIAMCGGRDFDRSLVEKIVYPWLFDNFDLSTEFWNDPNRKSLVRLSAFAAERAKIDLSVKEDATISLSENEVCMKDNQGADIYLDIPISCKTYNNLIAVQIDETIRAANETLEKAGLTSEDIIRIVFVGGPTCHKPLRDKVSSTLGIPANTDVNPMTAVAEGASIFAESIDWSSQNHARKNMRGSMESQGVVSVKFDFIARTPDVKTKLVIHLPKKKKEKYEFQIDSVDSGWSSGRVALRDGASVDIILSKFGENNFKAFVFNEYGESVALDPNRITIMRTAATVDSIPASHSVAIEVLDKLGGAPVLDYLVHSGDTLPKRGQKRFKAATTLKSGDTGSLNFKLWEGDITTPITDNRPIGVMKISGTDFYDGVIQAGTDIELSYEMADDGNIRLEITIPSIRSSFNSAKNFYSRQEGQRDYSEAPKVIILDAESTKNRADEMATRISDPALDRVCKKLKEASSLAPDEVDPEKTKEVEEKVFQAKKELAAIRKKHLQKIRQLDLDIQVETFGELRAYATPADISTFDNLVISAKRVIAKDTHDFEDFLYEMRGKIFSVLWKQDWFIVDRFKHLSSKSFLFNDKSQFNALVKQGTVALQQDDIQTLRQVVAGLATIQVGSSDGMEDMDITNIIKG